MTMNRFLALVLSFAAAVSAAAAEPTSRYLVATKGAPRLSGLRLLRDAAVASEHNVNSFRVLDLFAADLTASEAAALARSAEVRYVSKVIDVHLLGDEAPPAASVDADTPPRYSSQQYVPYGIDMVHARDVWPYAKGAGPIN